MARKLYISSMGPNIAHGAAAGSATGCRNAQLGRQELRTHAQEQQRQKKESEPQTHQQKWPEDRGIDGGPAQAKDALRLVQRVPPIDGELDDRDVNETDDGQNGGWLCCPGGIAHDGEQAP